MTFASLLLRLMLCLALVAGSGLPLPSMAATATSADAVADASTPCHGDAAVDALDVAGGTAPHAAPDTCCDGACACQCIVPAATMPDVALASLQGLPPARPHAVLRTPRAPPAIEFPTRPPIATA